MSEPCNLDARPRARRQGYGAYTPAALGEFWVEPLCGGAATLLSRAECEDAVGTCDQGGHTTRADCGTCGGADTALARTACEDSVGTCDVGAETTRAACEAENFGAGVYTPQPGIFAPAVYTPAVAYTPSLQATCQVP